jgi:class 3 adenylate cyclase
VSAAGRIKEIIAAEGLDLDIRIGLHMGPVVIGDFGGKDRIAYTLMGETVNSASRYEQAREDQDGVRLGTVRLSDTVFAALQVTDLASRFDAAPRQFEAKQGRMFPTHTSIDI